MSGERIEAQMTVPASTSVSASTGALTSAVVATVTAGTHYLTTLAAQLQTQLNENVQGYPASASAMASAVGYGTWTAGWLFNIASGNDTGAFGGVTMTAVSTPFYSIAGPRGGIDLAILFDSALDAFSAGDNFDVNAASDFCVAWVGRYNTAADRDVIGKISGSTGWRITSEVVGSMRFWVGDGVDAQVSDVSAVPTGEWYVGIAAIDRATNTMRFGVRSLSLTTTLGGSASTTLIGDTSNAVSMTVGSHAGWLADGSGHQVAALYIGTGVGCAAGLPANLSIALTNFANAINDAWTVSVSPTTGLATASGSFWPRSVSFTSTDLRNVLGFDRNFDYAQTAAQLATDIGYGNFTAGYLFNEASGNAASVFGAPATLTAVSTPTYSNLGARGGADLAVGFNSALDAFDGGDAFDVAVTEDLIVAWVGKWSAVGTNRDLFGKMSAALNGWRITQETTVMRFLVGDGVDGAVSDPSGFPTANDWYVGIAALDRAANTLRFGFQMLRTGTQTLGTNNSASAIGAISNAATFKVGSDAAVSANGSDHFVAALYVGVGVGYAAGVPANLSTALSNWAATFTSQTSTKQAKGLWIPGRPIALDGDPKQAPKGDDGRATVSPQGDVYGAVGTFFYHHSNVRFSHVTRAKVWASEAAYVNADWQTFYLDTQRGQHSWFSAFSRVKVYWDNAGVVTELGGGNVASWRMPNPTKLDQLRLSVDRYTGLVEINLGDLFTSS